MAEAAFSATNVGSAPLSILAWYRELRELAWTAAVCNLE